MFRIEGLGPKMDPEELRRKMRRDVLTSTLHLLLLNLTQFLTAQLSSLSRSR
uniref:Translocase of outer mitochondrial membrane 5 n=1 Tax=Meleagris gallopavo TaxID=9103 RepID=A0A803XUD4_MELGA